MSTNEQDREALIRTLVEHADCAPSRDGMDCGLPLPEPCDQDGEAGAFTRAHQVDAVLASRRPAPTVTAEDLYDAALAAEREVYENVAPPASIDLTWLTTALHHLGIGVRS